MLKLAEQTASRCLDTLAAFAEKQLPAVVQAAEAMSRSLAQGGKVLIFGNGGSAADAAHMAGELVNRFQLERPPLPALALNTDASVMTAIGNDYSFEDIFAKQIKALGKESDVALGISTSGRSANVLKALTTAKGRGLITIGLTGAAAQDMDHICDLVIKAPSEDTPRIQEVHGLVIHMLCEMIDFKLFGRTR